MTKKPIKYLNYNDILEFVSNNGEKTFRVNQIIQWLYGKKVSDFKSMTNLPKTLIEQLSRNFVITFPKVHYVQKSADKTLKYVIEYNYDKNLLSIYIEAVVMPSRSNPKNATVCISSQAGCAMACTFCATGKQGFTRNLYIGEIIDQVLLIQSESNLNIRNIVVMGQGEPFLNYSNVVDALNIVNEQSSLNIGARKITISTCGITEGINKLANLNKQFGLAISLHSAIQETRDIIMPGVKNQKLSDLKAAVSNYINLTNRRPTFEYLMLSNINDDDKHLNALIDYCKDLHCHINIIKYNDTDNSKYHGSNTKIINKWIKCLSSFGISTTLRDSRGKDINAACGQLINNLNK